MYRFTACATSTHGTDWLLQHHIDRKERHSNEKELMAAIEEHGT
jgi:hypothetical protein